MQLNSDEVYRQSGERAGKAATHQDWGMVNHQQKWFRKACRLEDEDVARRVRKIWDDAYSGERQCPPSYFR
jgi:hypothetical protein